MRTTRFFTMAAAVLLVVACSNSDDITKEQEQQTASDGIPFTATVIGQRATRGLTDNSDGKISASWNVGEQIALCYAVGVKGWQNSTATVTRVEEDGTAIITATLDADVTDGTPVNLYYPAAIVTGNSSAYYPKNDLLAVQSGTLAGISNNIDQCEGSGSIAVNNGKASLTDGAALTARYAICKFTLKNADGSETINASELKVYGKEDELLTTVTPASATNELWVAMMPGQTLIKFSATVGIYTYTAQGNQNLQAGKFYTPIMKMTKQPAVVPTSFEADLANSGDYENGGEGITWN